jgi:hypothetical protein
MYSHGHGISSVVVIQLTLAVKQVLYICLNLYIVDLFSFSRFTFFLLLFHYLLDLSI